MGTSIGLGLPSVSPTSNTLPRPPRRCGCIEVLGENRGSRRLAEGQPAYIMGAHQSAIATFFRALWQLQAHHMRRVKLEPRLRGGGRGRYSCLLQSSLTQYEFAATLDPTFYQHPPMVPSMTPGDWGSTGTNPEAARRSSHLLSRVGELHSSPRSYCTLEGDWRTDLAHIF